MPTMTAGMANVAVLWVTVVGAKSPVSLAIGVMIGLQKVAPVTKVQGKVCSVLEHVAEFRRGASVRLWFNQARGEVRGVMAATIGPSLLREAAGIDENISNMWQLGSVVAMAAMARR